VKFFFRIARAHQLSGTAGWLLVVASCTHKHRSSDLSRQFPLARTFQVQHALVELHQGLAVTDADEADA
jgi:hypothetical protein